jgi:hypothetical protein
MIRFIFIMPEENQIYQNAFKILKSLGIFVEEPIRSYDDGIEEW